MTRKRRKAADAPECSAIDLKSEEDVKIKFLLPYLAELDYKPELIEFNKSIEVQEGRKRKTIYADAVVYSSPAHRAPLLVCETKPPTEVLNKAVKEQTISYARLLPRIAPLVLITNGHQVQVFQTLNKNRIPALPPRKDLKDDFVNSSGDTSNPANEGQLKTGQRRSPGTGLCLLGRLLRRQVAPQLRPPALRPALEDVRMM